ncbi:MAG: hypothetical protein WCQ21_28910, partial [Verrucomicrobiota bacterium]
TKPGNLRHGKVGVGQEVWIWGIVSGASKRLPLSTADAPWGVPPGYTPATARFADGVAEVATEGQLARAAFIPAATATVEWKTTYRGRYRRHP